MKKLSTKSFINASLLFIYIYGITWFLSHAKYILGDDTPKSVTPIFMLLLLVISATISAVLIFGKPVLLYIEGFKKEALEMLFYTIGWLAMFLIIVGIIMALTNQF